MDGWWRGWKDCSCSCKPPPNDGSITQPIALRTNRGVSTEEPKAPRAADKSNSKAYTTVVTSVLTISELVALLLDLGCCVIGQMVGPHA